MPNLKKKRKEKKVAKEGEVVHQKKPKQQKTAKGPRAGLLVESREDQNMAEVRHQNLAWNPWLEMDGMAIP